MQVAVPDDYTQKRSERYCSSPTLSEEGRGVKKANVCRCHGRPNHEVFRRDTTPEYTAGDKCRPRSTPEIPVVQNDKSGEDKSSCVRCHEGSSVGEREVNQRSPANSEGSRQRRQPSSAESNRDGDQVMSRSGRGNKSSEKCVASAKGKGDPSSPSSGDDSSGDDSDRERGRRRRSSRCHSGHSRRRSRSRSRTSSSKRSHEKRWLKPEMFDGRTSFDTFMYMFQNCATYNR